MFTLKQKEQKGEKMNIKPTQTNTQFVVVDVKDGTYGRYSHLQKIAIVEILSGSEKPYGISTRYRGVVAIHHVEVKNKGKHYPAGRCAASKAYERLSAKVSELNKVQGEK
jgi:hypothetical protein